MRSLSESLENVWAFYSKASGEKILRGKTILAEKTANSDSERPPLAEGTQRDALQPAPGHQKSQPVAEGREFMGSETWSHWAQARSCLSHTSGAGSPCSATPGSPRGMGAPRHPSATQRLVQSHRPFVLQPRPDSIWEEQPSPQATAWSAIPAVNDRASACFDTGTASGVEVTAGTSVFTPVLQGALLRRKLCMLAILESRREPNARRPMLHWSPELCQSTASSKEVTR